MENNENYEVLNEEVETQEEATDVTTSTDYEGIVDSEIEDTPDEKTGNPALAIGIGILLTALVTTGVVKGVTWIGKKIKAKREAAKLAASEMYEDEIVDVEVEDVESCDD